MRTRAILAAVAAVAAVVLGQGSASAGPPTAPPGSSGDHAPLYYLALGDSLSVGWQPSPSGSHRTSEGYVNDVYAYYKARIPNLVLVNLGCQGDGTTTMITGTDPVTGPSACTYEEGSQLRQAVEFLHAHSKFVVLVTLDVGANNVDHCVPGGVIDLACISFGVSQAAADMPVILGALRAAASPQTPIVGMNYYDPFLGLWFSDVPSAQMSLTLTQTYNGILSASYAAAGMPVADVAGTFQTFNPPVLPSSGPPPVSVATICAWTWICTPYHDIHANPTGYAQMAGAFEAVIPS